MLRQVWFRPAGFWIPKGDYSRADNKGFKGICAEFMHYRVRQEGSMNKELQGPLLLPGLTTECNIIKISEAEVIECLRNRSASMSLTAARMGCFYR